MQREQTNTTSSMTRRGRLLLTLGAAGALAACGAGTLSRRPDGATGPGMCRTDTACWTVTQPGDYDISAECEMTGGTWQDGACPADDYARKCTQSTNVEVDGRSLAVVYVYFFARSSDMSCSGDEVPLR